jgi:hypothetical protein
LPSRVSRPTLKRALTSSRTPHQSKHQCHTHYFLSSQSIEHPCFATNCLTNWLKSMQFLRILLTCLFVMKDRL